MMTRGASAALFALACIACPRLDRLPSLALLALACIIRHCAGGVYRGVGGNGQARRKRGQARQYDYILVLIICVKNIVTI